MENKKIQEFKDDVAADKSVAAVSSSLTRLASAITNAKDYARVIEALMKYLKTKKGSQLSSLDSNQNYKMVISYLNKMQSEATNSEKQSQQPVAQK